MSKTIDFTKAITSGIIDFNQACALQGVDMTTAIKEGVISFEVACQLQGMAFEVLAGQDTKAQKAPRKKSRKSSKKTKPQPPVKKSETKEVYQMPTKHNLTDYQVKRLDNAVLKLWEAGYEKAEWRVQGKWAWIYLINEEKGVGYSPAFRATVEKTFKDSKWEYSERRGAVVYKDFLKK